MATKQEADWFPEWATRIIKMAAIIFSVVSVILLFMLVVIYLAGFVLVSISWVQGWVE